MLNVLKWTQIGVAFTTMIALVSLFFPSIEMFFVLPLGIAYVTWAIRAKRDKRWSMWLALTMSVVVAIVLSSVIYGRGNFIKPPIQSVETGISGISVDGRGEIVILNDLPERTRKALAEQQSSFWNAYQLQMFVLAAFTLVVWGLVLMHAFQWRWLTSPRRIQAS